MNTKRYHIIIGLLLILFGLTCTVISILTYLKPENKVDIESVKSLALNSCLIEAKKSGFDAKKIENEIVIHSKKSDILDNPMPEIYKSSILITKCENVDVKSFCVGEECEKFFTLKFEQPK